MADKPTRPKKAAPKKRQVLRITYDGKTYDLPQDTADIPVRIRMELTQQSGFTLDGIKNAMARQQVDDFMVAVFLFVIRRMNGEQVTFDQLVDGLDAKKLESMDIVEDDNPEA